MTKGRNRHGVLGVRIETQLAVWKAERAAAPTWRHVCGCPCSFARPCFCSSDCKPPKRAAVTP